MVQSKDLQWYHRDHHGLVSKCLHVAVSVYRHNLPLCNNQMVHSFLSFHQEGWKTSSWSLLSLLTRTLHTEFYMNVCMQYKRREYHSYFLSLYLLK